MQKGDRIELIEMPNDPFPIEPGARGTVTDVVDVSEDDNWRHDSEVHVDWDNGRKLLLLVPTDRAKVIERANLRVIK
jgi:hypothetical protein